MNQLLQYFTNQPKKLFLLDAIGAFLTATFIGVVMRNNLETFGLPTQEAVVMSIIACIFFCFSGICYLFVNKQQYKYIFIIATANSLYVLLSFFIFFNHFKDLTPFGIMYLLSEMATIILLVTLEFSIAKKLLKKK
jgi:CBS domain containing-hemolysin-like protein